MPLIKHILLGFLLFIGGIINAQLDNAHYLPPIYASNHTWVVPGDQVVYISTPSASPVNYVIADGDGNFLQTGTVSNAAPVTYTVNGFGTPLVIDENDLNKVLKGKSLQIGSASPIYVSLRAKSTSGLQATAISCKGKQALGKTFRIGHFPSPQTTSDSKTSTVGITATENNTVISIDLTATNVVLHGTGAPSTASVINVNLNSGESYVFAIENPDSPNNPGNGMIGGLITSNKNIAVTSGSWGGNLDNTNDVDLGLDQLVPVENLGKKHAIIKGESNNNTHEQVMVVAHENNTEVYINGAGAPATTLNAGQSYMISGSNYVSEAMYVTTSKPAYVFQFLLGGTAINTQAFNLIPPIKCSASDTIDLIPDIEKVGSTTFSGALTVVTTKGATLRINGAIPGVPPVDVPNSIYEFYKLTGLTGNVKITSSTFAMVGFYGDAAAAGYAGYYSGFEDLTITKDFLCVPGYLYDNKSRFDAYKWFKNGVTLPGETNDSLLISSAGNYTLEYTLGGCKDTSKVYSAVAPPNFTIDFDTTFCIGDSAKMEIKGAGLDSVTWSNGYNTNIAYAKNGASYTARVYADVNANCYVDTTISVKAKAPPTPKITAPFDSVCVGGNLILTANTDADTIWWNTGATTKSITVSVKGKYFVDARTGNNCFAADTFNVGQAFYPNLSLSKTRDTLCTGDSVLISATVSADSLGWNTGLKNNNIWIKSSGDYIFTARNSPNCRVKDTVKIVEFAYPTTSVNLSKDSVCKGDSIVITLTTNADSLLWNNGSTAKVQVAKTNGNLIATSMNGNFCVIKDTIKPFVANYPIISLNKKKDTICSGDSSSVILAGIYNSLSWSSGGNETQKTFKNQGKYVVTATNLPSCSVNDSFELTVVAVPNLFVSAVKDSICNGDSTTITAVYNTGNIKWNTGATTNSIKVKQENDYWATVTNQSKCSVSDTAKVKVINYPTMTLGKKTDTICQGDSVFASVVGNADSIYWSNGTYTQTTYLKGAGWHYAYASNKPGCAVKDSIELVEVFKPTISIGSLKDTICKGQSTKAFVKTNASNFTWNIGDTKDTITVSNPGKYYVLAYSLSTCVVKDSVSISQIDVPIISLPYDTTGCIGTPILLKSNLNDSVVWQNTLTQKNYNVTKSGNYFIEAYNVCGSSSKNIKVTLKDCSEGIVMPNFLTPNNDGYNDYFAPIKMNDISNYEITIYNRWGLKVFYSNQVNNYWDGTVEGLEPAEGTYFYTLTYTTTKNNTITLNGYVYLKR